MSEKDNEKSCGCGHEHAHNHEEGCGCGHAHGGDCGCGHDHGHEHSSITLTFEDGNEVECSVLGIFNVDEKEYIALLPQGEEDVMIYKYSEVDGVPDLGQIDSDEEYEKAGEALFALFEDDADEEDEETEE